MGWTPENMPAWRLAEVRKEIKACEAKGHRLGAVNFGVCEDCRGNRLILALAAQAKARKKQGS